MYNQIMEGYKRFKEGGVGKNIKEFTDFIKGLQLEDQSKLESVLNELEHTYLNDIDVPIPIKGYADTFISWIDKTDCLHAKLDGFDFMGYTRKDRDDNYFILKDAVSVKQILSR